MTKKRNTRDFSETTKRILAERVAFICSNPACRRLAIKPHEKNNKSNKLGDAGHIIGAYGPRNIKKLSPKKYKDFENGIWLCKVCHKIVDTETSTYTVDLLKKWKNETECYVEELVVQDTRLRQLRILCQSHLSALRVVSGLPKGLDYTFNSPNGNGINMTRLFMELELVLYDNGFLDEAISIKCVWQDFETVCSIIDKNSFQIVNISRWKNETVRLIMKYIMRFKDESYDKYFEQEGEQTKLASIIPLEKTKVHKRILQKIEEEKEYASQLRK
ncbi:MAG: hypothetical protein HYZ14_16020 [Bacteroidetes bacterium]|nr:hypothetical protein [Bacteroidota bacterium]